MVRIKQLRVNDELIPMGEIALIRGNNIYMKFIPNYLLSDKQKKQRELINNNRYIKPDYNDNNGVPC